MKYLNVFSGTRPHRLWKLSDVEVAKFFRQYLAYNFAILSPCKKKFDLEVKRKQVALRNDNLAMKMCKNIEKANFRYFPVYTGFLKGKGAQNEHYHFETFFVVLNLKNDSRKNSENKNLDFEDFIQSQIEEFDIKHFILYNKNCIRAFSNNFVIENYPRYYERGFYPYLMSLLKYHFAILTDEYFLNNNFEEIHIPPFCNPVYTGSILSLGAKQGSSEILLPRYLLREGSILAASQQEW